MSEVRWYKGKYKVRIIQRSNVGVKGKHLIRNMEVEALEDIPLKLNSWKTIGEHVNFFGRMPEHSKFTTVPRLLWRHPRK